MYVSCIDSFTRFYDLNAEKEFMTFVSPFKIFIHFLDLLKTVRHYHPLWRCEGIPNSRYSSNFSFSIGVVQDWNSLPQGLLTLKIL